jgi:hypothetical protein
MLLKQSGSTIPYSGTKIEHLPVSAENRSNAAFAHEREFRAAARRHGEPVRPALFRINLLNSSILQGFGEGDAVDALASGGGDVDAAVALLLARDRQGQIEASVRGSRLDSSSESTANPSALASAQQFCVRVSDIESGEQVRRSWFGNGMLRVARC